MRTPTTKQRIIIAPRVKKLLRARLDQLDMNPRELALKMENAYDHIRLIVNGEKFGSKLMMKSIAEHLRLDIDEVMKAYFADKAEKAGYKGELMEPKLAHLASIFKRLPDSAKDELITYADFKEKSLPPGSMSAVQ